MALWKPFRGKRSGLDTVEKHDGWIYFTTDDGSLFFDYVDADGNLHRKQVSAESITGVLDSTQVVHGEDKSPLSVILNTYILSIDYDALAFDTTEIVVGTSNPTINTTSVLGQAILGQLVLA